MTEGINVGQLSEMINDKMDRDLMNALVKTDFIVAQKAPDDNDKTWYRVYKSGWVEQGGIVNANSSSAQNLTVQLPKQMKDTNYSILTTAITGSSPGDGFAYWLGTIQSKALASFVIKLDNTNYIQQAFWKVEGFCSDNSMEGDDGETVFGNTYKTYFYSGVLPDYANGIDIPVSTTESTYTCTSHGRIDYFLGYDNATDGAYIKVNNKTMMSTTVTAGYPRLLCGTVDVKSGDVIKYRASTTSTTSKMTFYPYSEPAQSTNPTVTQIIDAIYPVGSIYIGTTVNCPIASIVGTWEKIDGDLVLQSSSSSHQANTKITAGLPDHTHPEQFVFKINTSGDGDVRPLSSKINYNASEGNVKSMREAIQTYPAGNTINSSTVAFTLGASYSNSIYGRSNTVQPPAYVVNIWKRTA